MKLDRFREDKIKVFLVLFVILLSCFVTFASQKEAILNKYVFPDDAAQFIFPFYRIQDKSLFNDDLLTNFSGSYNTKGQFFLYSFFSIFLDPLLVSKFLPFILSCITAVFFFLLGKELDNYYAGFLSAVIFVMYSWTVYCFSGAYARSFAFMLLASFAYYFTKKGWQGLAITMILQVIIYPPVAAISALALFIVIPLDHKNLKDPRSIFLIAFGGVCCLFALALLYSRPNEFMGDLFTLREMIKMPEFYAGGRCPFFINSFGMLKQHSVAERLTGVSLLSPPIIFLLLIAFYGVALRIKGKIRVSPFLDAILVSGLLLYCLSWLVLFRLYYPGRYLKYVLPVYLILLAALTINWIIKALFGRKRLLGALFFSGVFIVTYFPFLNDSPSVFQNKELAIFLQSLPKDALIAGHPFEMDEVPLFSKRKIFIGYELSLPFYKNYYSMVRQRTIDFFDIYYSKDRGKAIQKARANGIDYLVLKKEHFTRDYIRNHNFYIAPFNDFVNRIIEESPEKKLIFADVPKKAIVYEDDRFIVISLDRFDDSMLR